MRSSDGSFTTLPLRAAAGPEWERRHVLVMAKSPVPGRVKTRLCPPLSDEEAAAVARVCIEQTLDAVAACSAPRKLLALDGQPGDWIPPGFDVFPQRGRSFTQRLANAWADSGGPGLQIGMDTPQVTPELLDESLELLLAGPATAVLGPAVDGGWWAIGSASGWTHDVFASVPMSTDRTGIDQLRSLEAAGHLTRLLPVLRDLDTIDDARALAAAMPGSRLAEVASRIGPGQADRSSLTSLS